MILWSMRDDNDIRHGRHCVFKMHVHLVFVAKYRRNVFDGYAVRAILPRPERRGLSRTGSRNWQEYYIHTKQT